MLRQHTGIQRYLKYIGRYSKYYKCVNHSSSSKCEVCPRLRNDRIASVNMNYLIANSLPLHLVQTRVIDFRSCPDTGCRCLKISTKICPDTSQPKSSLFIQKIQKVSGLGSSLGRDNLGSFFTLSKICLEVLFLQPKGAFSQEE